MSSRDLRALPQSTFNPFLYADITAEKNGSSLTMLSVFAREGKDPWVEAARWAKLSRGAAIERLCRIIEVTTVTPRNPDEICKQATVIATLLPNTEWLADVASITTSTKTTSTAQSLKHLLVRDHFSHWLPMSVFCLSLALGVLIVVSTFSSVVFDNSGNTAKIARSSGQDMKTSSKVYLSP